MRVSPWNQYRLVDQETDPDLQLASVKNRLVHGCGSFVCFGRTASKLESANPPKVGPTQQQDILQGPPSSDKGKDHTCGTNIVVNDAKKISLKSSLKKPANSIQVSDAVNSEREALCDKDKDLPGHIERRKVKWTDASGGELYEIREFELSETGGSDDEFENATERTCSCRIM